MTWDEIVQKYPKQYVYLVDVQWEHGKGQNVKSAIVIYATEKNDEEEYIQKSIAGECVEEYTDHSELSTMGVLSL